MRDDPRAYFNLTPPTLQTDARVDGQQVVLKPGQALLVWLDEDPATGQRWEMQPLPAGPVIAPVRHDFAAKRGTGTPAGEGPGEALFRLRGVSPGTQSVVLEYRRPAEQSASKTIRFDVVVR
jgi:predicted secreted protein